MLVQVKISEKCYLKDPDTTELGKKIIERSIKLIDEIGFEAFTFKKLAKCIESTEASVYRYFENKHKLLIYLVSWYWNWVEYRLQFDIHNIEDEKRRLEIFVDSITRPVKMDDTFIHVDEVALHRIVISESAKAYLTKEVDLDNREGYFVSFKRLVRQVVEQIKIINPNYPFPAALVSTIIESAHNQKYFSDHLPSLSETKNEGQLSEFLKDLLFKVILSKNGIG
jgi:AcrR family transcriptional regulator